MNTIGELIALQDPDFILLSKAHRSNIQATVLLYLFRGCSSQDLSEVFKTHLHWSGQNCIDFRGKIARSGYLQKNLKLFFYAKVCNSRTKAEDFEVSLKDAQLVGKIISSQTEKALTLVSHCLTYYRDGYARRSLSNFDKGIGMALNRLQNEAYCEKFVNKKFLFLTQSGQKDAESIIADLQAYALRSAYRAYPKIENFLHLVNIMKQGIHNRGVNILKEETTQGRQRVTKNADGTFSGNLLSLNFTDFEQTFGLEQQGTGALSVCNSLMCGMDGQSAEYERPGDVDRKRDLREAVEVFYNNIKSDRPKQFMDLLMGQHDAEFSIWLGQPNEEAVSKMDRKLYVEMVRQYMNVPVETARNFMARMKTSLMDFRN